MREKIGIKLIGYFYIFGAIVLLMSFGVKQDIPINVRFGISEIPEVLVRVFLIAFSFIMAFGYIKLTKWGYWTMIIYSILFLIISLNGISNLNAQPFIGNAIFSIIVLIYTFVNRELFVNIFSFKRKRI